MSPSLGVHLGGGVTSFPAPGSRLLFLALGSYLEQAAAAHGGTALGRELREIEQVLREAARATEVRRRTPNLPEYEELRPSELEGWIDMKEAGELLGVTDTHARRMAHGAKLGEVRTVGRLLMVRGAEAEAVRIERAS